MKTVFVLCRENVCYIDRDFYYSCYPMIYYYYKNNPPEQYKLIKQFKHFAIYHFIKKRYNYLDMEDLGL